MVLNCQLHPLTVNVTFLMMQNDSTFASIVTDGTKYQKLGVHKLKINNLDEGDATAYVCRADGIKDKTIWVHLQKRKY